MRFLIALALLLPRIAQAQIVPPGVPGFISGHIQDVRVYGPTPSGSPIPVTLTTSTAFIGLISGSTVTAFQGGPWSVTVPNVVRVTPSTEAFSINGISYYRTDSFAAPGSGPIVNVSSSPLRTFGIEVTGGTTWDVRLEGSLDAVNFTLLLNHLTGTGNGVTLYSGTSMQPSLYLRSRVAALTGGPIAVTFVGVQ